MGRLTYRDKSGTAYTKIPEGLNFVEEGEMIINAIQKLAYYEDLEEFALQQCEQCKVDGYYAEWGDCDGCGCLLLLREEKL